jgi:hypothetical protein
MLQGRLLTVSKRPSYQSLITNHRKTKQDLTSHPLLPRLQSCDSPEAILTILREQTPGFDQSQNGDDGHTKWTIPTVNVLYSLSATLGGVVGLVNITIFPYHIVQSNIYFSGIPTSEHNLYGDWRSSPGPCLSRFPCTTYFNTLTSQATKDVRVSQDKLIDLFSNIERFFQRLEIYTGITPTTAMTDIIVDIMVEILTILATATKEVKCGRLSESMLCRFAILDSTDTSVRKSFSGSW